MSIRRRLRTDYENETHTAAAYCSRICFAMFRGVILEGSFGQNESGMRVAVYKLVLSTGRG